MKKIIMLIIIGILLVTGIFFLVDNKNEKKKENKPNTEEKYTKEEKVKLKKLNYINEKVDYFNFDYIDRYINYLEHNPKLEIKDIIIRVNIGLDKSFYTNTKVSPYLNTTYLLTNKYISMPKDYVPNNLETISNDCSKGGIKLVQEARIKFEELCHKAKEEGYTIRAMSSYRSYDYQFNLYNNYVSIDGIEKVDTYSARPGFSEHQTGLTIDVDDTTISYTSFEKTNEFKWMTNNAHKYGFILRYPKDKENITGFSYESWHYRYVGKEIATYIHDNNITFDEYYVMFIENKK